MRSRMLALGALWLSLLPQAEAQEPPPVVVPHDWRRAQERFSRWQRGMLKQRGPEQNAALRRILSKKIVVPSPKPAGSVDPDALWNGLKHKVHFDLSIMDPLGLSPGMPRFDMAMNDPSYELSLNVGAHLLHVVGAKRKLTLFGVRRDGSAAFMETEEAIEAGLVGPGIPSARGLALKGVFEWLLTGHSVEAKGPSGSLSLDVRMVSAGIGVTPEGDLEVSAGVGPKLVPEAFSDLAQVQFNVEGKASTPVMTRDVQWGSRYGVSQVASGAARAVTRLIAGAIPCPLCAATGQASCRECADEQSVTCPDCLGAKRIDCEECSGGSITCPTTEECGTCGGTGMGRCGECGGSGTVTEYYQGTESEYVVIGQEPVLAGFDANGDPFYRMEDVYGWRDVPAQLSRWVDCGSCDNGWSGSCGSCDSGRRTCSTCEGRGSYACGNCDGTGALECETCEGTGDVTCPTCEGEPIECPLCEGRKKVGQ